jgi:nitrilase
MSNESFVVAAAQVAPVFLDRKATLDKACDVIATAGREGAKLVVFPEAFIPAYPDWVWAVPGSEGKLLDRLYGALVENAVSIPDDATRQLGVAAKKAKVHVVMGINERNVEASRASLFNSLLYIDASGAIMGKHRKLIPTGGERTVWARGDGDTLEAYETPLGVLGGLICWENYMPLARQAMYAWGVQIYVAPTWDRGDLWVATLRHIAKEGGTFVIGCCMPLHANDIPERYGLGEHYGEGTEWINSGHSCIVNPRGQILAGPVENREEIVYAEVDIRQTYAAKRMLDVAGHYGRPDVLKLTLDRGARPMLRTKEPRQE